MTEFEKLIGHLGAALVQSIPSDDQIIMDHVREAERLAKALRDSGKCKTVYVKRWRTLVSLPAQYADEIVEALRAPAQSVQQPVAGPCPYAEGGTECLLEVHSIGPCLCANPVGAPPQTAPAPDDKDYPDCTTPRERELYDALMLMSSALASRRIEWRNWAQGGVKVEPVVVRALCLNALSRPKCGDDQ